MDFLFIIALVFVLLAVWRYNHQKYIDEMYKYKLMALKDKFTNYFIHAGISESNWKFVFFHNSIVSTIQKMKYLNFYYSLFLYFRHRNDKEMAEFRKLIENEISLSPKLQGLDREFDMILRTYIIKKHLVTFIVVSTGFYTAIASIKFFKSFIFISKESIQSLRMEQEIINSDDREFALQ